jgi:uncharacterized protein (TIGR02246 family)
MRTSRIIVCASLALAGCASAPTPSPRVATPDETSAFRRAVDRQNAREIDAQKRGDAAAVAAIFAPDAAFLRDGADPIRGRAAIQSAIQDDMTRSKWKDASLTVQEAEASGDTGYLLEDAVITPDAPDAVPWKGKCIQTWKRQPDGAWLISRWMCNSNAPPKTSAAPTSAPTAASPTPAHTTGIGGVFFKAADPKKLSAWYVEQLGFPPSKYGVRFTWREDDGGAGSTTWSTFPKSTTYFDPTVAPFMINYRVTNLDEVLARLKKAGARVDEKIDQEDYGRFGWAVDPEGNRFELWEPKPSH